MGGDTLLGSYMFFLNRRLIGVVSSFFYRGDNIKMDLKEMGLDERTGVTGLWM